MAIKIKIDRDGNKVDAYARILAINARRHRAGNNDFRQSGISNPVSSSLNNEVVKDFHVDVIYEVFKDESSKELFYKGGMACEYDLNSNKNIFVYCYEQLKLRVEDFKNSQDV